MRQYWTGVFYYMALVGVLLGWALWLHEDKVRECEKLNGTYTRGICFAPGIVLKGEVK